MKKILIIFMLMAIMVIAGYVFVGSYVIGEITDNDETYKELVGEEVVIKNDTLMIVDYSIVNRTVTLENAAKINVELAKKKLLK